MATAFLMLGHQVAAKAFRDAAFLAVWPATALPLMVATTAIPVVFVVPIFARLLDQFGPRVVVPVGFLLSAALHAIEWRLSSRQPWVAVLIYIHVAGFVALLMSGFWSIVGERFDPRSARDSFGRIAAAGTVGGVLGGIAAARFAVVLPVDSVLLMLAALHVLCAGGVVWLGRAPVLLPSTDAPSDRVFEFKALRDSPHLRTIALMVLLVTAGAGVLDYLLKWRVTEAMQTGPHLLRFFAVFYGAIQILSFVAQTGASRAIHKLGIGRTMSTLPAGVGLAAGIALLFPIWPFVGIARAIEAVLRNSLFRSGYELFFVPMDVAERRRTKTFIDVTCDRAGEALGAVIVQLLLFTSVAFLTNELLGAVILLFAWALWIGRRLDRLYLSVVERQLVRHAELTPVILGTETAWTMLDIPAIQAAPAPETKSHKTVVMAQPSKRDDPRIRLLVDLRSGDRARVGAALARLTRPDRAQVAQVIELLAWDDLVGSARHVLERVAPAHVGMLTDVLIDASTDFAVRRRIPRILGAIGSDRALDGLVRGLDDSRFEVRYQCGRAIDRLLRKDPSLPVDTAHMFTVVERELSVPLQVWQGHRLIDHPERDEMGSDDPTDLRHRNLEHVFSLLATVLPREPLQVALRGIRSSNPGLRGLALEYLESVLPPPILARLWQVVDVPAREAPTRTSPEQALEQLRVSAEMPVIVEEDREKRG
jgi:ATP:ADP antiporter, AAA family